MADKTKQVIGLKPFVLLMCQEIGSLNYLYSWMIAELQYAVIRNCNVFPDCSFEDVREEFIRAIKELGFERKETKNDD